jgi:DNA repair exonuclease SbcCD nuclease subunit
VSGPVRFVHAADLHLDAPFKGIDATDPRVREELVTAPVGALDAVVSTCLERGVDFLVLAGDVYNSAERSLRTEFAFRNACERLDEAGIRVFIARGNHDPASGRSAALSMPSNVHVFSANEVERVIVDRDGEPVCSVYGRSFRTAAETANLAAGYARESGDVLAVGVLHANVGGRPGHEPYAPCSLDDLRAARMDYWALGHIHKPEILLEDPPVVYSGCTQGLHPGERGPRGCVVVTLDGSGATIERVPTARVVWSAASVAADDLATADDVRAALIAAVERAAEEAGDIPAVVRLELHGRSEVHATLARRGVLDDLLADVRAAGLERDPWVWVDRLTDRTRPALDLDLVRSGADFAADLVRLADALLEDDEAAAACLDSVMRPVLGALDARDVPDVDPRDIISRARDLALDRLLAEEQR